MWFYLAARYSRRAEIKEYQAELVRHEHRVTSRWLDGSHSLGGDGLSVRAEDAERRRFAMEDWHDVMEAEVVISFTEEPRATNGRGGRHVEFGAALAMRKACIVIGPRENVFHHYPGVEVYPSWRAFVDGWFPGWACPAPVDGTGKRAR